VPTNKHTLPAGVQATAAAVQEFRQGLARLGDVYVNDAFGCAHRGDSSVLGEGFATRGGYLPRPLPQRGADLVLLGVPVAGLPMPRELRYFAAALDEPARPFLSILGGADPNPDPNPESVPEVP